MNAPADEARRLLDLQVASVLRACGGWNFDARRRVSALAQFRRIPPSELAASVARVAATWTGGSADHRAGIAGATADEAPNAAGAARPGVAPPAARARSSASRAGALGIAALLSASILSAALLWYAMRRADAPATASEQVPRAATAVPDSAPHARSAAPPDAPTQDAGARRAPEAAEPRDVPPVPAVYARPPALRVDATPAWSRGALESLAGDEPGLQAARAAASTSPGASDADRALALRVFASLQGAWPLLQGVRRDEVVRDACALVRADRSIVDRLRTECAASRDDSDAAPERLWQGAGAAGLLAALDSPSAEAEAFAPAARRWLIGRVNAVADAVLSGDPSRASGCVEAWMAAVEATTVGAGASADADGPALALLDALLRRDAPMARPGISADAAGTVLDSLGWTAGAARRAEVANAFRAWLLDPSVGSAALHGLTSVLASRRPGAWWDPWLVCGMRADDAARARAAERWSRALAGHEGEGEADEARARGVPDGAVERWMQVARAVDSRARGASVAERLVRSAERVALVEAARSLERGRASDAEARIAQVEDPDGLGLDDLDRWRGRAKRDAPRLPATDGQLRDELRRRPAFEDRAAFLRSLRTRSIGDLGPQDAAELAHEALCASSPQVRTVAQGVIVDAFADGPTVLAALAAAVPDASDPAEAAAVAAQACGEPAPRGSPDRLRTAAVLLLLDRHASLSPSDRHRLDAVSSEFAYSALAGVRAAGGQPPAQGVTPEAAFRAWFDARVAEARPIVPAAALAAVVARAESRRSLAAPGPQAFVAEQAALIDIDAAILVERAPRVRSAASAIVQRASAERAAAPDAFAQVEACARALQDLAALALAPGEVQR